MLKYSYPHLCIKNQVIHWLIQHHLWDTATKADYFTYLQDKFGWEPEQLHDIHWPLVNWAIQQLDKLTQRIISKFIHEWLPLEMQSYQVHSTSILQHCPSCHQQTEAAEHFYGAPIHNDNKYGKN